MFLTKTQVQDGFLELVRKPLDFLKRESTVQGGVSTLVCKHEITVQEGFSTFVSMKPLDLFKLPFQHQYTLTTGCFQ